ncbi:inducible alternative oxidase 2 [Tilletia horrida]|nr:inducible alternative oxidase 2 [Tilletia horrida]KAK0561489.1 inducible alternative oxidase 2 [Tilletia horrida]
MAALLATSSPTAAAATRRAASTLLLQHGHAGLGLGLGLHPSMRTTSPAAAAGAVRGLKFQAQGATERKETPKDRYGNWTLPHPSYDRAAMEGVKLVHHPTDTVADKFASLVLLMFRTVFDLATRYPSHHAKFPPIKGARARPPDAATLAAELDKINVQSAEVDAALKEAKDKNKSTQLPEMSLADMRKQGLCFGPEAWLTRIVFLETIAGAPGLVAGMVRHLQSLRLMRRDKGWIATLLEEAENERMHLLTFLSYAKPGRFMRLMILLAQGVFTNAYFIAYLMAPRIAHRWIGYLEEEACTTYTRIIQDLDEGRLPEWEHLPAPEIALSYWHLPPHATMRDVLLAVRADESVHRFANHTLANVGTDAMNPFAQALPPASVCVSKAGFSKEEAEAWAEQAAREAKELSAAPDSRVQSKDSI